MGGGIIFLRQVWEEGVGERAQEEGYQTRVSFAAWTAQIS